MCRRMAEKRARVDTGAPRSIVPRSSGTVSRVLHEKRVAFVKPDDEGERAENERADEKKRGDTFVPFRSVSGPPLTVGD